MADEWVSDVLGNGHANDKTNKHVKRPRIGDGLWIEDEPQFDLQESDFGAEQSDPTLIEPRGWLLGNWIARQFISSLIGDGAAGKTALRIACALALATGRSDILGLHVFERVPVLYLCFEDGERELRRRLWAAMIHHGIGNQDIAGHLFVKAITNHQLKLAITGQFGKLQTGPLSSALNRSIERRNIAVAFLDPLVKIHGVDENSNTAMDMVVEVLADLAIRRNTAIDVPQHTNKGLSEPGDANKGRGATAIKDGSRLSYTLCDMTAIEAETYGLSKDERLDLMRVDSGKVNLARKTAEPIWFRRVGVELGNTAVNPLYPHGDTVQTVERWHPPAAVQLGKNTLADIFADLRAGPSPGEFYSAHANANARWAGNVIIKHTGMSEADAKHLLRDWRKNGVLVEGEYSSTQQRKPRQSLTVVETKAAEILGALYRPPDE